jgi:uncharacterized protein
MIISAFTVPAQDVAGNVAQARAFIELLEKGEFEKAGDYFSDEMKAKFPVAKLKEVWESLPAQVGRLKKLGEAKTAEVKGFEVVTIFGEFEKTNLDLEITFDKNGRIAGFFLRPAATNSGKTAETYELPAYAKPGAYAESEVTVGAGEWALPGTLTVPKGEGKFPAVVIVHGSGPNDRDGTHVNPANKPYKDLALGLASKGVAVLRYEKRTRQHGGKLARDKTLTVKEEVIDDALAAVELLRRNERIDAGKVFVLGHSLGGYLLPRIAVRGKNVAGYIGLAGLARKIEDAFYEQNRYFANLDGKINEAEQNGLNEIEKMVAEIKALTEKDVVSDKAYIGAYPAYWLDLKEYEPAKEAKKIEKPFLVLQGERDYQVTMKDDFNVWQRELKGRKNVTFKSYPNLNHLFMPGEGTPAPAEYQKTGHVAENVIEDIAGWVKEN